MEKKVISTELAAAPGGPYAQAVVAGDFVYLAGATPTHADGTRVRGSFVDQARATFENLRIIAEAAGSSLAHAVRVGIYLRDFDDFAAMNELFAEYFGQPAPARTTLQIDLPGFDIEVDAVLLRSSPDDA